MRKMQRRRFSIHHGDRAYRTREEAIAKANARALKRGHRQVVRKHVRGNNWIVQDVR